MAKDLNIIVKARLDDKGSAKTIKDQLKSIQAQVGKITVGVSANDDDVKRLARQINEVQSKINEKGKNVKVVDYATWQKDIEKYPASVKKIMDQVKKQFSGATIGNISFSDSEGKIGKFIVKIEEANGKIRELNYEMTKAEKSNGSKMDRFKLTSITDFDNTQKAMKRVQQEQEKLLINARELSRTGLIPSNQVTQLTSLINGSQTMDDINRVKNVYKELLNLQKQLRAEEAERLRIAKEHQKYMDMLYNLSMKQKAKDNADAQKESLRVDRLGELKGGQSGVIPQNVFDGGTESIRKYVAQMYNTDASLVKVRRSIDSLGNVTYKFHADVKQGAQLVNRYSGSVDKATKSLYEMGQEQNRVKGVDFATQFATAMERFPIWMAVTTVFMGTIHAIKDMIATITELDTQMTNLKRVMNQNTNFDTMMENSMKIADEFGRKMSEVNDAMIHFAQAGDFNEEQLAELAKTAVVASNVSDLTIEQSASDLTSAMIQFNIAAKDSISIVDKMNEVDNNFAVTTKDLAEGIHKAGASAKTYGVTLDELIGYVTAVGAATRESGNVVGNGLKTMFSRINTKDSMDALAGIGIEVQNIDGSYKSVKETLDALGGKWSSLSNAQQQNIGVTIAGRYQLTRFLALMDNYQMALDATMQSQYSYNSASEENKRYMDSIQAQLNKLSGAWEEFSYAVGKSGLSDAFTAILHVITRFLQGMTSLTEAFHGWNLIIPVTVGVVYSLFRVASIAWSAINKVTLAVEGLTLATRAFKISLGLIGFGLLAVEAIYATFAGGAATVEDSTKKLEENAVQTGKTADQIEKLVDRYEQLKKSGSQSAQSQTEMKMIMQELHRIAPQLTGAINDQGEAMDFNADEAKKFARDLKGVSDAQKELLLNTLEAQIAQEEAKLPDLEAQAADAKKLYSEYTTSLDEVRERYKLFGKDVNQVLSDLNDMQKNAGINGIANDFTKSSQLRDDISVVEDYIRVMSKIDEKDSYGKKSNDVYEAQKSLEAKKQKVLALKSEGVATEDATGKIVDYSGAVDDMASADSNATDSVTKKVNALQDMSGYMASINEEYKKSADSVKDLNSLLEDLSSGKEITADRAMDLISKEKDLADAFTIENGQVKVNEEAVLKLKATKISAFSEFINMAKLDVQAQSDALKTNMQRYGLEIGGIASLLEAKQAVLDLDNRMKKSSSIEEAAEIERQKRQAEKIARFYELSDKIEKMAGESLNTIGTSSGDDKKIDALTKYEKVLGEVNDKLRENQELLDKYPKTSDSYRSALEEQIKLLKQKKALMDEERKNPTSNSKLSSQHSQNASVGGSTRNYSDAINKYSQEYGVDPRLVAAIIQNESGFNQNAISPVGAIGLMQLMPKTAEGLGVDPYNAEDNIKGGTKYIAQLLQQFGNNVELAVAAYNAGAGNVEKYGGIPPFKETQDYVQKVTQTYGGYTSSGSYPTNGASGNSDDQEAFNYAQKLKEDISQVDKDILDAEKQVVQSWMATFDDWIANVDAEMSRSQFFQGQYAEGTEQYSDAIDDQISLLKDKQNLVHGEANAIRDSGIQTEEFTSKLRDLGKQWFEFEGEIQTKVFEKVKSEIAKFGNAVEKLGNQVDVAKGKLSLLKEGSAEWNQQMVQELALMKKEQDALKEQEEAIKSRMQTGNLTSAQLKELQDQLNGVQKSLLDVGSAMKEVQDQQKKSLESAVDDFIESQKEYIKDTKEAKIKAIEDVQDARDKQHEKDMKYYDDEIKKIDDVANAKIKSIDDEAATEDFNKNLSDKQKDRKKIADQINSLSLDDSVEAKAKRKKLQEDLGKIDEEIEKMKSDREKQLRKEKIQENADADKKVLENKKDANDESYKNDKDTLEKSKKSTEKYYDDLYNDESGWAKMREDLLSGSFSKIKSSFDDFTSKVKGNIENLDQVTLGNLLYKLDQVQKKLSGIDGYTGGDLSDKVDKESQPTVLSMGNGENSGEFELKGSTGIAWSRMLAKQFLPDFDEKEISFDQAKNEVVIRGQRFKVLDNRNGHAMISVRDFLERFGMNLKWIDDGSNSKIEVHHDGGVIGGSRNPDSLVAMANKMLNGNLDETYVKSLVEEIQVPPKNIAGKFIPNLGKLISNIGSSAPVETSKILQFNFHIGTVLGGETGAKTLVEKAFEIAKKKGG